MTYREVAGPPGPGGVSQPAPRLDTRALSRPHDGPRLYSRRELDLMLHGEVDAFLSRLPVSDSIRDMVRPMAISQGYESVFLRLALTELAAEDLKSFMHSGWANPETSGLNRLRNFFLHFQFDSSPHQFKAEILPPDSGRELKIPGKGRRVLRLFPAAFHAPMEPSDDPDP